MLEEGREFSPLIFIYFECQRKLVSEHTDCQGTLLLIMEEISADLEPRTRRSHTHYFALVIIKMNRLHRCSYTYVLVDDHLQGWTLPLVLFLIYCDLNLAQRLIKCQNCELTLSYSILISGLIFTIYSFNTYSTVYYYFSTPI